MKRLLFVVIALGILIQNGFADTGDMVIEGKPISGKIDISQGSFEVPNSASLPATCEIGEMYMDTGATSGQRCYLCEESNTWVLQSGGGEGGGLEISGSSTANYLVGVNAGNTGLEYKGSLAITLGGFTASRAIISNSSGNLTSILLTQEVFFTIDQVCDGDVPPAAETVLSYTNKAKIRNFDGSANEDVKFIWQVPTNIVVANGIKFCFEGYIPNGTAPANTEIIAYSLNGVSLGNSDSLGTAAGIARTSQLTADATYIQYDYLRGGWSDVVVVVSGLAGGELVHFNLTRLATTTDTYAQDFALCGIRLKYQYSIELPEF